MSLSERNSATKPAHDLVVIGEIGSTGNRTTIMDVV